MIEAIVSFGVVIHFLNFLVPGLFLKVETGRFPHSFLLDHLKGIKEITTTTRQDIHRGMEWGDFKVTRIQFVEKQWDHYGPSSEALDEYRLLGKRIRPTTPQEDLRRIYNMKGW